MAPNALSGPRESTVRRLYALSMNQCAFPSCELPIVTAETNTIVAEVCHIHAQNSGGPRYKLDQNDEERHGFDNLILMCRMHHKEIDSPENLAVYTTERLLEMKAIHESKARQARIAPIEPSQAILEALRLSGTSYDSGSVHMDFRNAIFRVGGEGGFFGGAGGSGGVLTIVGLADFPPGITVSLDGESSQVPGGGGGGGGVVVFEGRVGSLLDIENGLKVSSFFTANAFTLSPLLNVLNGGWSYYPIPYVPHRVLVAIIAIFEFGFVEVNTMVRFSLTVESPSGAETLVTFKDVAAPDTSDLVRKAIVAERLVFDVHEYGVHKLRIRSGERIFSEYPIEFRSGEQIFI